MVDYDNGLTRGFKAGAEWQSKQAIEILSSVMEIGTLRMQSNVLMH